MNFPLVPVPEWLAKFLPFFFSPESHHYATVVPALLALVVGIAMVLPALEDGEKTELNRSYLITGLALLVLAVLFLFFGGYTMFLTIAGFVIYIIWALIKRALVILKR